MNNIEKLIAQLKRDEGSKRDSNGNHIVYKCTAGASTIGYGHNIDANPIPTLSPPITESQAIDILREDVAAVELELSRALPWVVMLDYPRYAVLVNMCFNMGLHGLLTFKNTLEFVRVGDYRNAAKNMLLSKWATQVGKRANRLAIQMETGCFQ